LFGASARAVLMSCAHAWFLAVSWESLRLLLLYGWRARRAGGQALG